VGYRGVVTAALAASDQPVFLDAGFQVVECLHLLRHGLDRAVSRGRMSTRRARRRDRPDIVAVDQAAFAPFWQLDEAMMAEAFGATRTALWRVVCGPQGQVIGYAICGRSGSRGYIQRLAVHPDHQGRGVGAALLTDGLAWLMRWGAHDALVNTQLDNQRSLQLYQRSGFVLQPDGLAVLRLDFAPSSDTSAPDLPNLGIFRRR